MSEDDVTPATARQIIRSWLQRHGAVEATRLDEAATGLERELGPWLRRHPYVPLAERWATDGPQFQIIRAARDGNGPRTGTPTSVAPPAASTPPVVDELTAPREDPDAAELSAIRLTQAVLAARDALPEHRMALLAAAVRQCQAARGARWTTPAAAAADPLDRHREPLVPLRGTVEELLRGGPRLAPLVLSAAVTCAVTGSECRRLARVSPELYGWERFAAAGLTVVDALTGEESDPADLPPGDAPGEDLSALSELVGGGPARICVLLACRVQPPAPLTAWALEAAARDSASTEGWWLEHRLQQLGDAEAAPLDQAVPALALAGAAFNSPALQAAAVVLTRHTSSIATPDTAALAAEVVRCAELEAPRRGSRACAPLARALLDGIEAADPRTRSWEELTASAAGGRFSPLAGRGDTYPTMQAAARLFDDPIFSLTVTIFEKRYRAALPEVPHPAVTGWLRDRWQDDDAGGTVA
ncbi:hypothetical protein [Blastococcus montanus]|uniref:hypothetical protein n=1 Tax=Blastococcus montanus TaxID=3144973 RepID=UPI0032097E3C